MPRLLVFLVALLAAAAPLRAITTRVVVASGDAAPFQGAGATWTQLETAYLDGEGTLTLEGTIATPANPEGARAAVRAGEDFTLIAEPGMLAPVPQPTAGTPISIASFYVYGASQGRTLLVATLTGNGVTIANDRAIILATDDGLHLVVREGDLLPGLTEPIVEFSGGPRLDTSGGITFSARGPAFSVWQTYRWEFGSGAQSLGTSSSPGIPLASKAGFALVTATFPDEQGGSTTSVRRLHVSGSITIAESGDLAPGFPEGWRFSWVNGNSCNDSGQVIFTGTVINSTLPAPENTRYGLWLGDGEATELLARVHDPSPAPGISFGSFRHPVINGAGDAAFFSGDSLFLRRAGQAMERVAFSDMPLGAHLPFSSLGVLSREGLHLSQNGNLVFSTDRGLWVFTSDNQLHNVAHIGQSFHLNGDLFRVTKLEVFPSAAGGQEGRRRSLSDKGHIAFVAELADVTSAATMTAVVVAVLPHAGDPGHAPTARPDIVVLPAGPRSPVQIPVLANDIEPDGGPLTIDCVQSGWAGFATIENGVLRYVPHNNFFYEDRFTYTIRDADGNFSTAEVIVRNSRLAVQGSYATTLRQFNSIAGKLVLNVGARGRVTGRFSVDGKTYPLRGTLAEDGTFSSSVTKSGETFVVMLKITRDEFENATLTGVIAPTLGGFYVAQETSAFGLPPGIAPKRITMQMRASPQSPLPFPDSFGFATGALSASGQLRLAGRLPDNRPFTAGVVLKRDGTFSLARVLPMFPQSKLAGDFTIQSGGADNSQFYTHWAGELDWTYHAGGPSVLLDAGLSTFTTSASVPSLAVHPVADDNAQCEAVWGDSRYVESATLRYDDLISFRPPNPWRFQLKVNRATGLVTGSFADPAAWPQPIPFRGVVFPPRNEACGIVPHPARPGYSRLTSSSE